MVGATPLPAFLVNSGRCLVPRTRLGLVPPRSFQLLVPTRLTLATVILITSRPRNRLVQGRAGAGHHLRHRWPAKRTRQLVVVVVVVLLLVVVVVLRLVLRLAVLVLVDEVVAVLVMQRGLVRRQQG